MIFRVFLWTFMLFSCFDCLLGQDPSRFKDEVEKLIQKDDVPKDEEIYVFTGSSSIRFWSNLKEDYKGYPVLNRGFGGSQMSDLIYYIDELILQYSPGKVFIYEGDNDISAGKSVDEVMADSRALVTKIHHSLPESHIYFISAKPSVARWAKAPIYRKFNSALSHWAESDPRLYFIDVWTPMCAENGMVKEHLFVLDKLHMNPKGYEIWAATIRPYVEE